MLTHCPKCNHGFIAKSRSNSIANAFREIELEEIDLQYLLDKFPKLTPQQIHTQISQFLHRREWKRLKKATYMNLIAIEKRKNAKPEEKQVSKHLHMVGEK